MQSLKYSILASQAFDFILSSEDDDEGDFDDDDDDDDGDELKGFNDVYGDNDDFDDDDDDDYGFNDSSPFFLSRVLEGSHHN